MNQELPDEQAGFRKGRGIRDQIANICWIIEEAKELQKNICFIDYTKIFDCVYHNKQVTSLPLSIEICMPAKKQPLEPNHWRVQNWERNTGMYIVTLIINLYAEYIIQNAKLDESQTGIKTAGRNINNLRFVDDITLMAESEQELESLDEGEREEWKSWLKTQHSKN